MNESKDNGDYQVLPPDPYDALTLENDIVGLRLWGPVTQPMAMVPLKSARAL